MIHLAVVTSKGSKVPASLLADYGESVLVASKQLFPRSQIVPSDTITVMYGDCNMLASNMLKIVNLCSKFTLTESKFTLPEPKFNGDTSGIPITVRRAVYGVPNKRTVRLPRLFIVDAR